VTGATATALVPDESGRRVERVLLRSLGGDSGSVAARHVVLCSGGIENVRLLLVSRIANEHDTVGRWFQDHVVARAGTVETAQARLLQTTFGVLYRRGLRWYPRLALARPVQEAERVLACGVNLVFEPPEPVRAALRVARGLRARRLPARADAALALRGAPSVAAAAIRRYGRGWSPASRSAAVRLLLIGEQAPSRDSRVTLSERLDPLGVPLPRVEWRPAELERRTLEAAADVAARQLRATGLGELTPEARLRDPEQWRGAVFDSFHHAGGTRMSADPRHGVVDRDCRVHGLANLFVAGSSVFPSSGYANPTLTIAALAFRLADRLQQELRA
jgi:choline dehydrogenase-like flavoprotein